MSWIDNELRIEVLQVFTERGALVDPADFKSSRGFLIRDYENSLQALSEWRKDHVARVSSPEWKEKRKAARKAWLARKLSNPEDAAEYRANQRERNHRWIAKRKADPKFVAERNRRRREIRAASR